MSDSAAAAAPAAASAASQLYLHHMNGKIKMLRRQLRGKDGRPGDVQFYMANTEHKPNANLTFVVGDADVGRLARIVRAPSTYQDQANSAYTISVALEGEDAEGAKMLWNEIIAGMKEHNILDRSLVTTPDIMKMISHPIISVTEDGAVFMTVTLGDDVEYLRKITKGKMAGKFARITRDQVHKGDRVVIVIKLDRHREKPRHRFNRYAQRVFVIERSEDATDAAGVVGSSGKQVEVVDYDSSLENDDEEGKETSIAAGAGADSASSKRGRGAEASEAAAAEEGGDDDAFEAAMKRARGAI
jgi:hypothetical protein